MIIIMITTLPIFFILLHKSQFMWYLRDQIQLSLTLPVSEKSCTVFLKNINL